MTFTADDQELMYGSNGSLIRRIAIPSDDPEPPFLCVKQLIYDLQTLASAHYSTKAISVDEAGMVSVLTTTPDGMARVWTVGHGEELPPINTGIVGVAVISRDGKFMLTTRSDGALILWDIPPM